MTRCYEEIEMSIITQVRAQLAQAQNTSNTGLYSIQQYTPVIQPVQIQNSAQQKKWKQAGTILAVAGVHLGLFWLAEHLPTPELELSQPEPVVMEIIQPEALPQIEEIQPPEIPPITEQPTPNEPPPVQQPVQAQQPVQPQIKPVDSKPVQPQQEVKSVLPPEPAPVPEPVAKVQEVPVIPAKGYAGYLSNPAPEYPEVALERGWEGEVILRVKVSPEGQPIVVNVQRSSGKKLLDDTAVKTVKRWKFSPAKQGNQAVEGWVEVPIGFQLPE